MHHLPIQNCLPSRLVLTQIVWQEEREAGRREHTNKFHFIRVFCIRHVEDLIVLPACLLLARKKVFRFAALFIVFSVPTHTEHLHADSTHNTHKCRARVTCMSFYARLCVCVWASVDFAYCSGRLPATSSIYAISSFWLNWFSVTISILRVRLSVCLCECDSAFDCFTWPFCLALFLPVVFVNTCINIYVNGSEGEVFLPLYYECWPKNASGIKFFLILRMYPKCF